VTSLEAAMELIKDEPEAMMIGGAALYLDTLPVADQLYMTEVHAEVQGDTWFPEIDPEQWKELSRTAFLADKKNDHDYSFVVYERVNGENKKSE
jgi:dihydrofolate reductase